MSEMRSEKEKKDRYPLDTDAGALEWFESTRANARVIFEKEGELMPAALVLITKNPETGAELDLPGLVLVGGFFEGSTADEVRESKEHFEYNLRQICREHGAIGVIFLAESWSVKSRDNSPEAVEAMKNGPPPSEHPDRIEVIFATMEHFAHPGKTWTAMAEITRDAAGVPSLGDWELHESPTTAMGGRFARLLRKDYRPKPKEGGN